MVSRVTVTKLKFVTKSKFYCIANPCHVSIVVTMLKTMINVPFVLSNNVCTVSVLGNI